MLRDGNMSTVPGQVQYAAICLSPIALTASVGFDLKCYISHSACNWLQHGSLLLYSLRLLLVELNTLTPEYL